MVGRDRRAASSGSPTSTRCSGPTEGYTKGDLVAYYFNVASLIVPAPRGPPAHDEADAGRRRRTASSTRRPPRRTHRTGSIAAPVLCEDAKHGRDRLPDGRRHGGAAVHREPRLHRDPSAALAVRGRRSIPTTCSSTSIRSRPTRSRTSSPSPATSRSSSTSSGSPRTRRRRGATGLQIYVPVERGALHLRAGARVRGRVRPDDQKADPDRVTMAWKIANRAGKVFIDHNMNRQGANIAAAYSLRPEPRAPVSTPLTWDEVSEGGFEPQDFRIDNVWDRFAERGDLFAGVRTEATDLTERVRSARREGGRGRPSVLLGSARRPPPARSPGRPPRRSSRNRRTRTSTSTFGDATSAKPAPPSRRPVRRRAPATPS